MRQERVTLWDRLTYHNRFTDVLMRMSGMRNWRRNKRQMIPFAVSVKFSAYCGLLAAFGSGLVLTLTILSSGLPFVLGLVLWSCVLSFVLTLILQFISNCWWNARAMKLNSQPTNRPQSPKNADEFLGELPEILR